MLLQRFASVVLDSVLDPSNLSLYTWHCHCISVVLKATHKACLRALEVCTVSLTSPWKVQHADKGVAWRSKREQYPPSGHYCFALHADNFVQKANCKNWVCGQIRLWSAIRPFTDLPKKWTDLRANISSWSTTLPGADQLCFVRCSAKCQAPELYQSRGPSSTCRDITGMVFQTGKAIGPATTTKLWQLACWSCS